MPPKVGHLLMAITHKPVSKQRKAGCSGGSSASIGVWEQNNHLNMTACNFNDCCLALSEWSWVAASPPATSLSLSKRSAVSQLLLKYESGFRDLMAHSCHGAFIFSLHEKRLKWGGHLQSWTVKFGSWLGWSLTPRSSLWGSPAPECLTSIDISSLKMFLLLLFDARPLFTQKIKMFSPFFPTCNTY